MNKIFIQIASYRDPQLIPTIESALKNAKEPENLVFGICRQYHPEDKFDNLNKYRNNNRFKIIDVLYLESRGACWARNQIQQLYDNEEYTLQIDSHMRFEENWDSELIEMLEQLKKEGYKKPILTGYPQSFNPDNDPEERGIEPLLLSINSFNSNGILTFKPITIPYPLLHAPIKARFYAAGFCFTIGEFAREVQHDPECYFLGEEITITVRAYTHQKHVHQPKFFHHSFVLQTDGLENLPNHQFPQFGLSSTTFKVQHKLQLLAQRMYTYPTSVTIL